MMNSPASYDKVAWYGNETPQSTYSDLYRNHLNVSKDVTNRWTQSVRDGGEISANSGLFRRVFVAGNL
ncbi:MAG: hypothetical protein ACLU4J_15940 [Butyricimonas paravirosa]